MAELNDWLLWKQTTLQWGQALEVTQLPATLFESPAHSTSPQNVPIASYFKTWLYQ